MKQIDSFVDICINKGYITQDQAPWLRYGIEKRITTFLVSIPMLIIGSLISSPAMSVSFYFSFFFLRTRTNGIHAESFSECFILSILAEVFFLGVLPCIWNRTTAILLLFTSAISIFILAPYDHPNMKLSSKELAECARSAKKRLFTLVLVLIVLYLLKLDQFASGVLLGIVMVAVTLIFAYIPKGGKRNEATESYY